MKAFKEPAKLADRVIAPGDGAAEPGVTTANLIEPAKLATDVGSGQCESHFDLARVDGCIFVSCPLCGLGSSSDVVVPQARPRHRLGLSLGPPASQAG